MNRAGRESNLRAFRIALEGRQMNKNQRALCTDYATALCILSARCTSSAREVTCIFAIT